MKISTQGLIENAIPAFLERTHAKCRFILKRLPDSWKGAQVVIEELEFPADDAAVLNSLISLGRNEIDHSNHELFVCPNPNQLYFCFESSKWALINRV